MNCPISEPSSPLINVTELLAPMETMNKEFLFALYLHCGIDVTHCLSPKVM